MLSDRDIGARLMTGCPHYDCSCRHADCMEPSCRDYRIWVSPPPHDHQLQPCSLELCLDDWIKIESGRSQYLGHQVWDDLQISTYSSFDGIERHGQYPLMPGQFILASTLEKIYIPVDLAARAEGKSSIGRRGVGIHVTAGLLDPGFEGTITLEMFNLSSTAFWLKPGMKICQVTFEKLETPARRPYGSEGLGSHYQGQQGVTASVSSD